MSTIDNSRPEPALAPEARRRAPQLREGPRGRARGVRRARRLVDLARGDRAARRGRDRHPVPPLPQPAGAARGGLRRRGRGALPLGRRLRRPGAVGRAGRLAARLRRLPGHQAGARRRAAGLHGPGRAAVHRLPRRAVHGRRAAARARAGAGVVRADTEPRRHHPDGRRDRQDPGADPGQIDRILDIALDGLRAQS